MSAPGTAQKIRVDPEEIAAFCRRSHIRKLAFFGSSGLWVPDFEQCADNALDEVDREVVRSSGSDSRRNS